MPPAALAAILGTFGIPALITVVVLIARAVSSARKRRQGAPGAPQYGLSRAGFWAIWITVGLICLGFVIYAVFSGGADFS